MRLAQAVTELVSHREAISALLKESDDAQQIDTGEACQLLADVELTIRAVEDAWSNDGSSA